MNLSNGSTGQEIINTIRIKKGVYTEVIFYSTDGEQAIRKKLANYQIDGVYCADRRNEDFTEKVTEVIRTLIKKVQDLNNMRGLVMAETSDFDKKMKNIVEKSLGIAEYSEALKAKIVSNTESRLNEKVKKLGKCKSNPNIEKFIKNVVNDPLLFSADHKKSAIQQIIDLAYSENNENFENMANEKFSTDYFNKIISIRNSLAHVTTSFENGEKVINSENNKFVFNNTKCTDIRNYLITYRGLFNELEDFIDTKINS
jgi:hypothetical protein